MDGKYLALKPLHMDGKEIVISAASSVHDERSISYDQTDDMILLDKCRTTRLDTPIITMEYPIAGTNGSTETFIQQVIDDSQFAPGTPNTMADGM